MRTRATDGSGSRSCASVARAGVSQPPQVTERSPR
jgi:hypothetical protein